LEPLLDYLHRLESRAPLPELIEHLLALPLTTGELRDYILLMLAIGFDGDHWDTGKPQQWVKRMKWPTWVKAVLAARDRGACARCQRNLIGELLAESHVDHIVPLARGGCNDVVNLQLLCDRCNGRKHTKRWAVRSSMPNYMRRSRNAASK